MVVLMAALYTFLFWHESLGINLIFFTSCLTSILLFDRREALKSPRVQITMAGALFSGAMVVLWNSTTAVVAHITSFYLMTGFIYAPEIRAVHWGAANMLINQAKALASFLASLHQSNATSRRSTLRIGYWLRVVILPVLFLLLFYIIYLNANDKFAALSSRFWNKVFESIDWFFQDFSFAMFFLFLSGILLCAGVLLRAKSNRASQWDEESTAFIARERRKSPFRFAAPNALKTEYRTACLLLVLVNVLLLVVNYTDIRYVWLNFRFDGVGSLSQFVHEGTHLLILSILLSMGLIIFYFRKNLNFYPNNRVLRLLAVIWMIQNALLAMSVAIRNWYYVEYYALAYKRIGVFIFLILVFFGLITMMIKIQRRHTGYQLLRVNALAAFFMLVAMSAINWDPWIIQYNLTAKHHAGFDASFCFIVSEKAIPVMLEHMHRIEAEMQNGNGLMKYSRGCNDIDCFKSSIRREAERFVRTYEDESILSWNYTDAQTYKYLSTYLNNQPELTECSGMANDHSVSNDSSFD